LIDLKGNITAYANKNELITELNNCAIIMQDSAKSIIFPEKLTIKSKFGIKKQFINLDDVNILSTNIDININGRIIDYFGKAMPTLDLGIRLNKSKIEDIISIIPPFKIEEINTYYLKKYKFYGDILANIKVKGRLPEPEVYGDIYIDNGILSNPIPNTTKGATIKLNLDGKVANFDVVVPAGLQEKVYVKGSQDLYNIKYADFTVKSTNCVNLKSAQEVLNPLHKILNFIIGPVPIMDINGIGNIDIIVKGNRKNPHVWGVMNFVNTNAKFIEMPNLELSNANAILSFKDQDAHFATKEGIVNGVKFYIDGICNLYGKFDFKILTENQPIEKLYKSIKTSTMIPEITNLVPELDKIKGLADLNLKIYGTIADVYNIKFKKNLFATGEVFLRDCNFNIDNIEIKETNGNVFFEQNSLNSNITAKIGNLPLNLKTVLRNNMSEIYLDIPKLNPNFLIPNLETRKKQYLPYISLNGKYKGLVSGNSIEEIIKNLEYDKLNIKAKILESNPLSKLKFSSGEIVFSNNVIDIKNIKGNLSNDTNNTYYLDLKINDVFSNSPDANGNFKLKTPDLSLFNEFLNSDILTKNIRDISKNIEFKNGKLDLNGRIINSKLYLNSDLSNISFIYIPLNLPISVVNGSISSWNNNLKLNKINTLADGMPILVDGEIKDIFEKQYLNLYFNSKPNQDFIDKYINRNQIYPIKIKGDIVYYIKVKGVPNNYDLKAEIDLSKDSSVYHFGATIGDVENSISATLDSKVLNQNIFKIKEFSYDKLIDSQNGRTTRLNMLKAWGGVHILKNDLAFENLHIKTLYPTDARIFNIIFRKPNIKQGQFTSDLKLNGNLSDAKVLGDFHIFETNIPFLDTTMKNIELVFKDKIINFNTKGEILGNEISFKGILKNKLSVPYKIEQAVLYTKKLNLNEIVNKIKIAEVERISQFESLENFDLNSFVANNFEIKADDVELRNIHATNFNALMFLESNGLFNVKDFGFNIAQGVLNGSYKYNLKNNDLSIKISAENINANDITWALFDLNNQIYGDMTGTINLSCNGIDFQHCMQTLNGDSVFNVKDGRMPKLGSLEYLLKASNLVKGGITGLSINSIIDVITPLKTGNFSDIYGQIRIKDGIARNIEISSEGEDLNLFIDGTYNFATSNAEMQVLGILSRKISTFLGPIGNISINTLFNTIPGVDLSKDSLILEKINKIPAIELSSKAYRKFVADIKGNINGEDYVTSFKWIN